MSASLQKRKIQMSSSATITVLLLILILTGCTGVPPSPVKMPAIETTQEQNPYAGAEITTKIIPSVNNTFGYDILLYGKRLIHQPSIPGLPGNEGFTTAEKTQTVADFVLQKVRRNEMPPTVTIEDLNRMGVLK